MTYNRNAGRAKRLWILMLGLFLFWECVCFHQKWSQSVLNETEMKRIALTFDDGPHPIYTATLLEGLKKRGVVASFFVTGANAKLYPELIFPM